MDKLDNLLQEIYESGIRLKELETEEIIAIAIELNNKKTIVYDNTQIKNRTHARTILAHEFCHFETGTLYRLNDDRISKDKKEYKCNKYMVQKLVPVNELKELICKNYLKHEIAEYFEVEEYVIDLAIKIYKAMGKLR